MLLIGKTKDKDNQANIFFQIRIMRKFKIWKLNKASIEKSQKIN